MWGTKTLSILKLVMKIGPKLAVQLVNKHFYIWLALCCEELRIVGSLRGLSFRDDYVFQALRIDMSWAKNPFIMSQWDIMIIFCPNTI